MKPCEHMEDQTKCTKDYKPKSSIDSTCWRYRKDLDHCNCPPPRLKPKSEYKSKETTEK